MPIERSPSLRVLGVYSLFQHIFRGITMRRRFLPVLWLVIMLFCFAAALSGCGQKGDLYIPDGKSELNL